MMGARRINLLPPEVEERRRNKRLVFAIAASGLAVVVLFGFFYAVQLTRLSGERDRLATQQAENAELRGRIAQVQQFADLAKEVERKIALLSGLTEDEVRWSVVLADISLLIPSEVWLTNFTGSIDPSGAAPSSTSGAQSLGSLSISGITFEHVDVAKYLSRFAAVRTFNLPYLSLSQRALIGDTPVVNFQSSVLLSDQALRKNQRGAARRI